MKLIIAIVNDDDARNVMDSLSESGFMVTKLCSSGGFLQLHTIKLYYLT